MVKLVTSLGSLHWPSAGGDSGPGGISYDELHIFFMSSGLVRGFSLRKLFLAVRGLIAQFQCRLFLLVQALTLGDLVGFLVLCCVRYVFCLVVWAGFFLVLLVPIIAGYGISVGFNPVMVSLPGLVRLLIFGSLMSCFFSLVTLLGRGGSLLRGTLPLRYCTSQFAHKVPTWSLPASGGVALQVRSG